MADNIVASDDVGTDQDKHEVEFAVGWWLKKKGRMKHLQKKNREEKKNIKKKGRKCKKEFEIIETHNLHTPRNGNKEEKERRKEQKNIEKAKDLSLQPPAAPQTRTPIQPAEVVQDATPIVRDTCEKGNVDEYTRAHQALWSNSANSDHP
ncbi:hypothetical protein GALMADRAFT_283220 [Galerina marginata CBS 339.88]|uniref:Uncharacterized protein n=1 Tax=Galerina marginata (strain CBS 339.88) TaxID=685588 RepID=A0A067SK85_GALM3|nr:hypothetical protein GALMADRAFT_283220 [Galerina marginata CBS 339.88]